MRRRSRFGVIAALIAACALMQGPSGGAGLPQPAVLVGTFVWQMEGGGFGGFSGLDLSPDGQSFVVVSDAGLIAQGRLTRDAKGGVAGVQTGPLMPLRDGKGNLLSGIKTDAEGLAWGPDGRVFVSFEGLHRVLAYPKIGGPSRGLPRHTPFDALPFNAALEALAIDAEGTIYTLPEQSAGLRAPFPVFRFKAGKWDQPFGIPRSGPWGAVGADIGPDGRLYLLERDFNLLFGFRNRVRRFDLSDQGVSGEQLLFETTGGAHDNLESIAVWQDQTGATRLTMISDDNFRFLQQTEIVDYRLQE